MTFEQFTDQQWEAIRSTHENWPEDVDWRRAIERIGQDIWELQALKEMWVNELRGKPAKQREKIRKAWILMRQLERSWLNWRMMVCSEMIFPLPTSIGPSIELRSGFLTIIFWFGRSPGGATLSSRN